MYILNELIAAKGALFHKRSMIFPRAVYAQGSILYVLRNLQIILLGENQ
ncbi:hypothetical protein KIS4809_0791 [Bacillus sp. ZZV12-4809]|nr:hypothetical protein KIS4809_0791 [Bacillus sp. ZZV12-4809]